MLATTTNDPGNCALALRVPEANTPIEITDREKAEIRRIVEGVNVVEDDPAWEAWARYCHSLQARHQSLHEGHQALLRQAALPLAEAITAGQVLTVHRTREREAVPPPGPWYTTREAAVVARIGWSTLQRAVNSGVLRASNVGSALRPRWRVHKEALDNWIAKGCK